VRALPLRCRPTEAPRFEAGSRATLLLVACWLTSVALGWSGPVSAQTETQGEIVVRYSGPRTCSSAREFIERASPRLPTLRFVERGRDVGLEVVLTPSDAGVSAQLVIHLASGGTLSRSILASSCDEATEAIAFVASVALDPGAQDPVLVQSTDAVEQSAWDETEASEGAQDDEPAEAGPRDGGRRASRKRGGGGGGMLGVGAALGFGVGPEPMLGPELSLHWASGRPGAWSPALLVGAQYLILEGYRQPGGVASFHQARLSVDVCPSLLAAGALSLRPCAGLGGGWVKSEGSETEDPGQATRPYFDAHLGAFLALALGRQSAIVLSGYAAIPWIRDSYRFDSTVFHQTAVVTAGLGLSIGARLW